MVFGPTGNRRFWGSGPGGWENLAKRWGALRAPPFGRGFRGAEVAQTQKVGDSRSVKNHVLENPSAPGNI